MGCSQSFPAAKFYVQNNSDVQLSFHVAQVTKRKIDELATIGTDTDLGAAGNAMAGAKSSQGMIAGAMAALPKISTNKNSNFKFIREETTFAIVPSGRALEFLLPSGRWDEVFVTIKTVEGNNSFVICDNYSPPRNSAVIINRYRELTIAKYNPNVTAYGSYGPPAKNLLELNGKAIA